MRSPVHFLEKPNVITVYLPTFNRRQLLARAVESVRVQSYRDFELLIVDDGSNDDTLEYIASVTRQDSRVRLIEKGGASKGASVSRNIAIAEARGNYITGLDDDDYFHPHRLEKLIAAYKPRYSCVSSNYFRVKSDGGLSRSSYISRVINLELLVFRNAIGNQIFTETDRLVELGGFDESLAASQDIDLWIRLVERYGSAFRVSEPLYYLDASHIYGRISNSSSRITGTRQFVSKHSAMMDSRAIAYKSNSMGSSIKANFLSKIRECRKYGFKINFERIRLKLKFG